MLQNGWVNGMNNQSIWHSWSSGECPAAWKLMEQKMHLTWLSTIELNTTPCHLDSTAIKLLDVTGPKVLAPSVLTFGSSNFSDYPYPNYSASQPTTSSWAPTTMTMA